MKNGKSLIDPTGIDEKEKDALETSIRKGIRSISFASLILLDQLLSIQIFQLKAGWKISKGGLLSRKNRGSFGSKP